MDFDLIDLADVPDLVETCAAWSFGVWGCQSGGSFIGSQAGFVSALLPARQAFTVIGRRDGKPAGMASLRASDFKDRPDLTPWLAAVYVHPDHRRLGLAHALVRRVEGEARLRGHTQLYLISEHAEALYADLGWTTFDHVIGSHGPAVLMSRALT